VHLDYRLGSHFYVFLLYSSLYPYNGHFFAISGKDRSLPYKPENKCIFDLFSAYYLFRANPDDTLSFIDNLAQEVCQKWNDKYSSKEVTIIGYSLKKSEKDLKKMYPG